MKREISWRGIQLRADDNTDGHVLEGIAVPFGEVIDTWDGRETFDPDCVFDGLQDAKLCYQHGETIGRITNGQAHEDGLHITARISNTARGRDAITLIRDGVLDSFSVGFMPVSDETDKDGVTHRKRVRLLETSIVSWPAYENAKLTGQRSRFDTEQPTNKETETRKDNIMENNEIMDAITSMQEEQRVLKAAIAKAGETHTPELLGRQFKSRGEYLQAMARGDEAAATLQEQCRDLIATADTGNTAVWIADDLRLIEERRKVTNLLTHDALPAQGMSMEYHVVTSDTTTASKQTKEGATLKFGKLSFGTKNASVETFGGYTSLSRQVIERSTTPMLNTALRALQNAYAKVTEEAVRTHLYTEIKTQLSGDNHIDTAKKIDALTIDDWVSLIVDASELADERNVSLTRLAVSKDVLKTLVALKDTGDRFFNLSGSGADTIGSFDLTGVAGEFMRVPVVLLPKADAGTAAFIDPTSVTVWESGGPTQLTDGNVTNLTNDYSVYGYMAVATTLADGLIPVKFAA